MTTFIIKVAEVPVQITAVHNEVKQYCSKFITVEAPSFSIVSSMSEIALERKHILLYSKNGTCPYSNESIEFFSIHRRLSERLSDFDTFLIHASSISFEGDGYVFLANSGVGKSTHVQNWIRHFGHMVEVINDDKPYIKFTGRDYLIYGSPWNGKECIGSNISAPLRYVIFLERSDINSIYEIQPEYAYISLLQHAHFPSNRHQRNNVLNLLSGISSVVKFYCLNCTAKEDSALVAYNGIHHVTHS